MTKLRSHSTKLERETCKLRNLVGGLWTSVTTY